MYNTALSLLIFSGLLYSFPISAQTSLQEELAELDAELDAIFSSESDSVSLMALIDGLLKDQSSSELQLRLGYSSRVTSAGRDFGIDQQGLIPGISYYHKSGAFIDLSGFWNSELNPKYNLTVITAGYQGQLKNRIAYSFSYDHSFYSKKDSLNTLTEAVSTSMTYFSKFFYGGIDYSYSFGTETAHRIILGITGNFSLGQLGPFDKVMLLPSFSMLFGTANITGQYINTANLNQFTNATERQLRIFARNNDLTILETRTLVNAQQSYNNGTLTQDQEALLLGYFAENATTETFDLLNYYLTLPIVFYKGPLSFFLSYNYNIPKNISSDINYDPNGYFGFTVSYKIGL